MRTTNKEFKQQVQDHIIEGLETPYGIMTALVDVKNDFNEWYSPYEQKRTPNKQDAFIDYLNGLPSTINLDYTYHDINKTLHKWFTNCGMVYVERTSQQEHLTYHHLVYREFNTLCKKYGVNF